MPRNHIPIYLGEEDVEDDAIDAAFQHWIDSRDHAREDDGRGRRHVEKRMKAWRYYIRRLVTEQPFLRTAIVGILTSVNTSNRTCTAIVEGEQGTVTNIKYYPPTKTPSVGEKHTVHFEVKLPTRTMREDSRIQEGERWIKLYGGQYLYWTSGDEEGVMIMRINWPGSNTDEPELVVRPPEIAITVDTGDGAEAIQVSGELLGVDGNGLMWVQWDVVSGWSRSIDLLNERASRGGVNLPSAPSNKLRAYKDYGKGDPLSFVTLPPGYVARWADMTSGSSYISLEQFIPSKVKYDSHHVRFSDWITVTAGGVTINLNEHGQNTCLTYSDEQVIHERPYPALLDFVEGVCEYHIHWARNTMFTTGGPLDRSNYQFEMNTIGEALASVIISEDESEIMFSVQSPTFIILAEGFIGIHYFVLGFNYTGSTFGATLGLVSRPGGEIEAEIAGDDGRKNTGRDIELRHLGSEIESNENRRESINGINIPRNRCWTEGEGNTAQRKLLSPWGRFDNPIIADVGALVFYTPPDSLGGTYTRDKRSLSPLKLTYRLADGSDNSGDDPEPFFMDWYAGGPDDNGNIRGFGRWHTQPPVTQDELLGELTNRNDDDSKVYWRHSANDEGTGITGWEEFTEFEYGNHIAQDRGMDNLLISEKADEQGNFRLFQTIDNGRHWQLTDWRGGRGNLSGMFNPPPGNAVIVDVS